MDVNAIVQELDTEIERLQAARTALLGLNGSSAAPAPIKRKYQVRRQIAPARPASKLQSPAFKKRMSQMMKARWAERRKAGKNAL